MQRISRSLYLIKFVFPVFWFGLLAVFIGLALTSGAFKKDPLFLVGPMFMAAFGFVLMRKLVWDLVDEVYDCGDSLLVKGRGMEERVPLSNIMNVSVTMLVNPPRITLYLAKPGKFGPEIAFSPAAPWSLNPFEKSAVARDLIKRVDAARVSRGR